MENLQRDGPDSGTPFEPPTAAERRAVRSERVVLTVCAPVLDGRHAGDDWHGYGGPDADPELTDEETAAASAGCRAGAALVEPPGSAKEHPGPRRRGSRGSRRVAAVRGCRLRLLERVRGCVRGGVASHRLAIVVLVRPGVRRVSTGSRLAARGPGRRRRPLELAATSRGRRPGSRLATLTIGRIRPCRAYGSPNMHALDWSARRFIGLFGADAGPTAWPRFHAQTAGRIDSMASEGVPNGPEMTIWQGNLARRTRRGLRAGRHRPPAPAPAADITGGGVASAMIRTWTTSGSARRSGSFASGAACARSMLRSWPACPSHASRGLSEAILGSNRSRRSGPSPRP